MASRRLFDPATIEIGQVPIEAVVAGQTITLNRLESTAQVYNPTVIRQVSLIVSLNRLESTAQIFLPSVVQASGVQTITLNLLNSAAEIFLPSVIQASGVQTITLNLLGSTAQIYLPTINLVGAVTDTSDILDRYRKKRSESKEEEAIAAQLLKARQKRPQIQKQRKELIDWKKLIYKAINGADSEEELQAISTATIPTDSPEVVAVILSEIEQRKEARRLELKLKIEEAALKSVQLEHAIVSKQEEQRKAVEAIRKLQEEVLARHAIAMQAAEAIERKAFLELQVAEQKAVEFTRKRNNRIKRLKALMWLAKLDL